MTYNGADIEARKNLASTINTPVEVLRQLSADPEAEVRCLVASNPNTPTDILQKLGEEFPESVTANPVFDFLALENPDSKFIKLLLARSSTTPEETLTIFAKSEDEEILCAVAKNVATPIDILQKLAVWYYTDERTQRVHLGSRVHACVAKNPKTLPSLLKKLADHENSLVRQAVASNINAPFKVLNKLARDREPKVRRTVAENPRTPIHILYKLANSIEPDILRAVAQNENTPIDILERFANSQIVYIRQGVANNVKVSVNILEKFANDEETSVRASIARNPATPVSILERFAQENILCIKVLCFINTLDASFYSA